MRSVRRFFRAFPIFFVFLLLTFGTSAAFSHAQAVDFEVRIKDASLSVDAAQAQLGRLMEEISRQAGFELSISPELRGKTLNTSFAGMDLEDGIRRILGLVNLKSYIMEYAKDGSISRLDVFPGGTAVAASAGHSQTVPSFNGQTAAPGVRTGISRIVPGQRPAAPTTRRLLIPERQRMANQDRSTARSRTTVSAETPGAGNAPAGQGDSGLDEPPPFMPEGTPDEPPPFMPEDTPDEPPPFMPEGTPDEPPPFMPEGK